ncbi:hypothetical protein VaNZ11_000454 [Volvox africanus]|uniref:Undecaprenyldiphospho-muramoylpentapeptide beta-N-acetylglucosaminyltransferase n=1 Tax=Volvox africanus TaxID=51714 RepID=A0ABQ5RN27_9CHLO|nr:hypothetical protein VaNZ11_000454 [Volvox africanus]
MPIQFRRASLGACITAAAVYTATFAAVRVRRCQHACPVVAFAGGGAGSHIFPAVAIAEELRKRALEVVFLGDSCGLEVHVVPQSAFRLYCISSVSLQRPMKSVANALSVLRFPLCLVHSACVLVQTSPHVVVGIGGNVSVPACVAAAALDIPLVLYEPNAKAGAVTQALNIIARQTLLVYESAAADLRCRDRCMVVGPAVRSDVLKSAEVPRRRETREALGFPSRGGRLLLVLGGSRGCGYLNCAVNNALPQLAAVPGLRILWQTGAKQYVSYSAGHAASLSSVRCVPFIHEIGPVAAAADLVLSRAGASTVAELAVLGTPALLVPSPAVSEEQQAANARVLADRGQAEVVPQVEVDESGLAPHLLNLLAPDGKRLAAMRAQGGTGSSASTLEKGGSNGETGTGAVCAHIAIMQHIQP